LILGPSAVSPPVGVTIVEVESTGDLSAALDAAAKRADVIVMAAAVADYRPAKPAKQKLKRGELGAKTTLDLTANPDLLAGLGKQRGKKRSPLLIGFAAETQNVVENARKKLATKRCDLIVANDISEAGAGFGVDTNRVTLVDAKAITELPAGPKTFVAHGILDRVAAMLGRR
jgi:phosphopantothenoylcysteine decarboxylase / phosphopantothenate---cysteine ligase